MRDESTTSTTASVLDAQEVDVDAHFRRQINHEVATSMPKAVALFMAMMIVAQGIEYYFHPDRFVPLLLCITALTLTCVAGIAAVRFYPPRAAYITLATVLTLAVVLAAYLNTVGNSAELCLLAMIGYLTGLVVVFPWGPRYQAAAALGIITIYTVSLGAGARHPLPMPYGMFALITHALMTIIGASLLDRYRWSAFNGAALADRNAAEAARANRAKTDFLASVSHELRTPLNIIFGYTDLLIEEAFASRGERDDALKRIRTQSANLLDMIQAMLDINKLEAGGISIDTREFRIGELMDQLRGDIPASWSKEGVSLVWKADDGDASMRSDTDKIVIILRNLIHNALKYTDSGEVRVEAAAAPGNCKVDFTITDTGQGVPNDDLDRIFQMFQQSGDGPPRQGGVGLGLFLVKQLTTALGGTIQAQSSVGVGSAFTVTLPLQAPEQPLSHS